MNHRVLITGGTGFIGRQTIAPLIDRGFDVILASLCPPPADVVDVMARSGGRVSHRTIDLLAADAATALVGEVRPTHLLHLAWDTRHGLFWNSAENELWVAASRRLLDAFVDAGGVRFVGAGTCVEYAPADVPISETAGVLEPSTPYGRAKLRFRKAVFETATKSGVSAAWGRVFHLFGPHEQPARLVPAATIALLAGRPFAATSGTQVRDYSSVIDVAAAFAAILDSTFEGDINVAGGTPTRIADLLGTIGALIGRPELLRLGDLPTPPNDVPVLASDSSRLRALFPRLFAAGMHERLHETIAWWRQRPPAG